MTFVEDLEALINRYSMENGSDTPDFILADYLVGCLESFETAIKRRDRWYGKGKCNITEPTTIEHFT